jgi:hypothetical protein
MAVYRCATLCYFDILPKGICVVIVYRSNPGCPIRRDKVRYRWWPDSHHTVLIETHHTSPKIHLQKKSQKFICWDISFIIILIIYMSHQGIYTKASKYLQDRSLARRTRSSLLKLQVSIHLSILISNSASSTSRGAWPQHPC